MEHCGLLQMHNVVSRDSYTIDHDVNETSLDEVLWHLGNQQS